MPYRYRKWLVEYKLRCVNCSREQRYVAIPVYNIGDVIEPSGPHVADKGMCVFCKRPGLMVLERSDIHGYPVGPTT